MSRALKTILDESNPNKLPNAMQILGAGRAFALMPRTLSGTVTTNVLTLPSDAKAVTVLKAYARVGAVTGYVEPVADDQALLLAGQCQVTAGGDILFLAADAVTEAEVTYLTSEGELVTETLAVAANLATLPSGRRALILVEVSASLGGAGGAKTTAARGSTPGAGASAITDTGETIEFAAADAITQATVTYVAFPGTNGETSFNDAIEGSAEL